MKKIAKKYWFKHGIVKKRQVVLNLSQVATPHNVVLQQPLHAMHALHFTD